MDKIIFATSNKGKFDWFQRHLNEVGLHDLQLEQAKLDLTEIQSMDIAAISLFKARQAYDLLQTPVVVMDGGFYIDGLNGFPAAYTRDMTDTIPMDIWGKIISVLDQKTCHFKNVATYIYGPDQYEQFFDTTGDVFSLTDEVWPTDRKEQWSALWRVLVPSKYGYTKPLASFDDEELESYLQKRQVYKGDSCMEQVARYLSDQIRQAA